MRLAFLWSQSGFYTFQALAKIVTLAICTLQRNRLFGRAGDNLATGEKMHENMQPSMNKYTSPKDKPIAQSSGDTKANAMDLQGNIENFKLPDIFQLLAAGRKSGTLGIQREDDIVMVYFDNGLIVYGYGPHQIFHIGRLLKDSGKISEAQLDQAVLKQSKSETNERLGQILIDMGHIDRADVMEVVRSQVEELLYSLIKWQTGSFKFYEDQYPTQEEITVEISAENVILEGLRRLDEMNHLRDTLPAMSTPLAISQVGDGHNIDVSLCPEEWNLLALIDGRRNSRDIIDISNLSEIETLKKLAALKLAGLICPTLKHNAAGLTPELTDSTGTATEENTGALTGGTDRLESMMTRLAGLMEDFLQGSGSPSSSVSTGKQSSSRLVGDKPLTEILAESVSGESKAEQKTPAKKQSDEQEMWNEFAE